MQFVPDPEAGERVNIGLVVFDDDGIDTRLLADWSRVQTFGGRPRAASVRRLVQQFVDRTDLDATVVAAAAVEWANVIQITTPRASLAPRHELLDTLAARVLKEPAHQRREHTRTALVGVARQALEYAVHQQFPEHPPLVVEPKVTIAGRYARHTVDLVVRNGHLLVGAQALTFPATQSSESAKAVAVTAWTIEDVAAHGDAPSLTVIVAPPSDPRRNDYVEAVNLFRRMDAQVVHSRDVGRWATKLIGEAAPSA
jgi:hypothetical protein